MKRTNTISRYGALQALKYCFETGKNIRTIRFFVLALIVENTIGFNINICKAVLKPEQIRQFKSSTLFFIRSNIFGSLNISERNFDIIEGIIDGYIKHCNGKEPIYKVFNKIYETSKNLLDRQKVINLVPYSPQEILMEEFERVNNKEEFVCYLSKIVIRDLIGINASENQIFRERINVTESCKKIFYLYRIGCVDAILLKRLVYSETDRQKLEIVSAYIQESNESNLVIKKTLNCFKNYLLDSLRTKEEERF